MVGEYISKKSDKSPLVSRKVGILNVGYKSVSRSERRYFLSDKSPSVGRNVSILKSDKGVRQLSSYVVLFLVILSVGMSLSHVFIVGSRRPCF